MTEPTTVTLQSFDQFDERAEFDPQTGELRRVDTDRSRRVHGWFSHLDDTLMVLQTAPSMVLHVGDRSDPLNDVTVKVAGSDDARVLEIYWAPGDVQRLTYEVTGLVENDPTPFVEREHFDVGEFLHNVRYDPARQVSLWSGRPVSLPAAARSVSFVDELALVVLTGKFGDRNLLVLGTDGAELARLGTTCGLGLVDQVFAVGSEVRVVEATHSGDFQARFDIATFTLERIGEWR